MVALVVIMYVLSIQQELENKVEKKKIQKQTLLVNSFLFQARTFDYQSQNLVLKDIYGRT